MSERDLEFEFENENDIRTEDFEVVYDEKNDVRISGILRLPSPVAYVQVFKPIRNCIEQATKPAQIDVTEVSFLNSSGITALARLVVHARSNNKPMVLIGKDDVPWQRKSLTSMQRLWDQVEVFLK